MTRVIHTADTHIGYRQYHSPERRRDFLDAFQRVVDDAVEEGVDAVVHAGDIFHDRRPDLPDLLGTIAALRDLAEADIPFLAIVGNHEDKREAQWLDLFEQLDLATRLDADGTVVGDVTLYGLDYVPRARRDDLEYAFAEPATDHTALVAHGLFEPFVHAEWDTEALLDAASVDFDALLLGDNHHPDTAKVDGTWATYAGSTERVSADEEAARGYNLVTFDDGVDVARRGLPTREFHFVDVELREGEGVERVRERVREHDCEDAVVYVRVRGEGEPFPPAEVETFATERGALVARVNDHRAIEAVDEELDVSFADPDEAVRERVREMGLSGAALTVDEAVRESGLPDSNVRDTVRRRVEDLLDEDPDAFEPVAAGEPAGDARTGDAEEPQSTDGDDDASDDSDADGDTVDGGSDGDAVGDDADDAAVEAIAAAGDAPNEHAPNGAPSAEGEQTDEEDTEDESGASADEADGAGDGQASVEDFL